MMFGAAKAVLFIEVSSLQGVLIRGVPLQYIVLLCTGKLCRFQESLITSILMSDNFHSALHIIYFLHKGTAELLLLAVMI